MWNQIIELHLLSQTTVTEVKSCGLFTTVLNGPRLDLECFGAEGVMYHIHQLEIAQKVQ